jgi:hypothetical protein
MTLGEITGKGSGLPNRYLVHGCEGCGKTSFAAYTPRPIFIQTKGETGLDTLIDSGQLPETPHFPEIMSFGVAFQAIEWLIEQPHEYGTLVIDTLNGLERLCHEEVCRRDFNGDMTDRGFMGYMRGYEVSLVDWRNLLSALDMLREKRRMAIVCLCHTKVKPFRNPVGADYDRYAPDMHDKTWGLSHKWADAVLFIQYETFNTEKDSKKKGKAVGGQTRIMCTEHHAAYDAKNRMGLPGEIEMGNSASEAWGNFKTALVAAKQTNNGKAE